MGEIQQVLLNLLVNAAHAIEERVGETGARGNIRVTTRDEAEDLVILVHDDGIGIAPHIATRIFEPFYTTKPVGKGSGQGLSLARSLVVERHGGQISFDSLPGAGTTFRVRLPIAGKSKPDTAAVVAA
jgi:signal transduction histidine kinase